MKILILGGTGFVGRFLSHYLIMEGHDVIVVSRSYQEDRDSIQYWAYEEPWPWKTIDAVVHLNGKSIAEGLWTSGYKKQILQSRIDPIKKISEKIQREKITIHHWIQASGVSRYRSVTEHSFAQDESSIFECDRSHFLQTLCQNLEETLQSYIRPLVTHTTIAAFGIVLDPQFGYLRSLIRLHKYGIGPTFGSGEQYLSWIGIDDLTSAIGFLIENPDPPPIVNCTSPFPLRQKECAQILSKHYRYSYSLSIPSWILKSLLGQQAQELFLDSSCVLPHVLIERGFLFETPKFKDYVEKYL